MSFDPTYPHPLALLPPKAAIANANFGNLLLKARVELAELKGASGLIPNPQLLIAPVIIRESVASSNIENINTTLADVLQWQLFPEAEQRPPDKEVLRYREAMNWGFENYGKFALSSRLITGIHGRLIPNGGGRYRREQNQIANLASQLNKHYTTTSKYLEQLARMGILRKAVVGKYHLFVNHKLLKLLRI
jgi:Fic family protein